MARDQDPAKREYDERVWHRGHAGVSSFTIGVIAVVVIVIGSFLAYTKQLPFTGPGYEIHAVFENAATLRSDSPVRIAGVNVGKVTSIERHGNDVEATFFVDDAGQPIHTDAQVDIRPRLFLEGNFFLDVDPGSPSAPELPNGGTIPVTQTGVAVQLDEILTSLQSNDRQNLKDLLEGFGTALNHQPTAAEDQGQDSDVQGESAATAIQQSFQYGGAAGKNSAIVNQALLGQQPHDLSKLIAAQRRVFGKLLSRETQLQDLITNFNTFTGALASESGNLSETVRLLAPTLEEARPALLHLNQSFPQLRAFARDLRPGIAELPGTINAAEPWLRQANPLLGKSELGGIAAKLEQSTPKLAQTTHASKKLLTQSELTSNCFIDVIEPAGNVVIDNAGGAYPFSTGQSNFREFFYGAADQAGESQGFDGNGSYVRFQTGGGPTPVRIAQNGPAAPNNFLYGNNVVSPMGSRPGLNGGKPPYRPDVPCDQNPVPDINGAAPVIPPSRGGLAVAP
jgi:phospholipid/cholesterol/gamma-HCH transport system substrate-binding protein